MKEKHNLSSISKTSSYEDMGEFWDTHDFTDFDDPNVPDVEMDNSLQPVFIRHKLGSTPKILRDLWDSKLIAIHYEDIRSINPEDYKEKRASDALKRLLGYCEMGAIVGATYDKIEPKRMLVGVIEKGSKVEWTDKYGDQYIYKIVQLTRTKIVSYLDYPLLSAIRPRQITLSRWPSAAKQLRAILFEEKISFEVRSLAPSQLEVICYEFLCVTNVLRALLLPIGRSLPDIDIYGINHLNECIIAQVTQSSNPKEIQRKKKILEEYQSLDTQLYFFGPDQYEFSHPTVKYHSIQDVFKFLTSDKVDPIYSVMIQRMLKGG